MTEKKRPSDKKSQIPFSKSFRSFRKSFGNVWNNVRERIAYPLTLFVTVLVIFFLIRPPAVDDFSGFQVGMPSQQVVTSPIEYAYVDEEATAQKRKNAESLVSPVYRIQAEKESHLIDTIRNLSAVAKATPLEQEMDVETWAKTVLEKAGIELPNRSFELNEELQEKIPNTLYQSLHFYKDYDAFWSSLITHIQIAKGRGIADDVSVIRNLQNESGENKSPSITVGVTFVDPEGKEMVFPKVEEIKSEEEFFVQFNRLISNSFPKPDDLAARQLANELVLAAFKGPTLIYDQELTEKRRQEKRENISPIKVHVAKDETIIGKGRIVTYDHLTKLKALQEKMQISPAVETGYFVLAVFFVLIVLQFLKMYHHEIVKDTHKIAVVFAAMIMILFLARICAHLAMLDLGSNTLKQVGYCVPMGALGVILTILAGARLAAFSCTFTSVYMGIALNRGLEMLTLSYILVAIFTACAAIFAVTRIRQRSDLYRAGGGVMILAGILILTLALPHYETFEQLLDHVDELKYALIWGAVNGALVSILSIALLPLFEDMFGVATDIKLLELSQKNELLQRLEQEAPGSYQHTMRVATMAESAAEAIGANALLVRVGCYYHDIGKIVKPQYFVENQHTSAEKAKHSKLSPNMSCLIIRNHVKYGLELAKQYNLPKVISDFIPEHHGTTLMTYFYHEALANQETEGTVKEEDFRYPGPKPQSKETAILMLADSIEAASRTLESGSEREVRQLVRKLINEKFMDEQFDQCNLTLEDLHTLFLSFSGSIMHMLHQRIVYPTLPPSKEKEDDTEGKKEKGEYIQDVKPTAFKEKKEGEKSQKGKSEAGKTLKETA